MTTVQPKTMFWGRRSKKGLCLTLFIFALWGLVGSPWAAAHTYLDHSTPQDGETVEKALETITLVYNSQVREVLKLHLSAANGKEIEPKDVTHTGKELTLTLKEPLTSGHYTVTWEIVSEDGHVLDGSLSFEVKWDPPKQRETVTPKAPAEEEKSLEHAASSSPTEENNASAKIEDTEEENSEAAESVGEDLTSAASPAKLYWPWLLAGILLCLAVGVVYYWRRQRM